MQLAYREKVIKGSVGNTHPDRAYAPTYVALNDYSPMVSGAKLTNTFVANGDTRRTIKEIFYQITNFYPQVSRLAKHLKADTLEQTAYNDWHFVKRHLAYAPDEAGKEQVRTPARSWHERHSGVDCDCMTVFVACLLINQGYLPTLEIIELQDNGYYQHIYLSVGGFAIDTVPEITRFNRRSPGITTTLMIPIYRLEGLGGLGCPTVTPTRNGMLGLGCVPPTPVTLKLIEMQRRLLQKARHHYRPHYSRKLRKLHYLILLNGLPEQAIALGIMPSVVDISLDGVLQFNSKVKPAAVANYFKTAEHVVRSAGLNPSAAIPKPSGPVAVLAPGKSPATDAEWRAFAQLHGLGKTNIFQKIGQNIKKAADKVNNDIKKDEKQVAKTVTNATKAVAKTATNVAKTVSKDVQVAEKATGKFIQTAAKDVANVAKDVYKFIGKYDPINVLIRAGIISMLKGNTLNIAKNLRAALYTDAEVKAKNGNLALAQKARTAYNNFKETWLNVFGGTESDLQNAIKAGSGLQGLGDASDADVATAVNSITTASGAPQHKPDFFQIIGPILKKLLNDLTGINLDAIFPPSSPAGGPQLPAGYNPPGGVLPPAGTPLFNANGSPVLNPDGSQAVSPGPDNGGGFNPSAAANAVEQAVSDAAQLTRKDGKNAPFNKTVHQLQKKGKLPPGQLPIPGKKKKLPAKPAKGGGGGSGLIIPLAAGVALFALSGGSKSKH